MTHQELEHLASDYLEGSLDAVRLAEAHAHLDACSTCREMIAGLDRVLDLCRAAEEFETPPWMVNRILLATVGERKPTLGERLSGLLKPTLQPRLVYGVAMAVFSMTFILHAAGLKVGEVTLADLNPTTWVNRADRTGHLLAARAEKFYYDLRVVYEIESRLNQLRGQSNQPSAQPGGKREAPKSAPPSGGTTESKPAGPPVLAQGQASDDLRASPVISLIQVPDPLFEPRRSSSR